MNICLFYSLRSMVVIFLSLGLSFNCIGEDAWDFVLPEVQLPSIPARSVSIADFGAVPDGKTLNTQAFLLAMDAMEQKGGGCVLVPPGLWLTGPIELRSNMELHLEAGALVLFRRPGTLPHRRWKIPPSDPRG